MVPGDDEDVAIYDPAGNIVGAAPRTRMRREGLWHAASSVLVLSGDARSVYVHRRTPTKDVYPGMYDCWAGGVVAANESPERTAERELAEELGVHTTPRFLFRTHYDDGRHVRFHAFIHETRWDGPIVHQPEEVETGWWMPLDELRTRLSAAHWPFVPDGRRFIEEWFAARESPGSPT